MGQFEIRPCVVGTLCVVAFTECRLECAHTFGVGTQPCAVRAMPCAIVWPLVQARVCGFECLLFGEQGKPLRFPVPRRSWRRVYANRGRVLPESICNFACASAQLHRLCA